MYPYSMKFGTQLRKLLHYCVLWSVVSAAAPQSTDSAAYVTVDESTLYVQGGTTVYNGGFTLNQFFSLDLTQSWNTSSPLWSEVITAGPIPAQLTTALHSISLSRNQKTLTFWNMHLFPPYAVNYHLDTNSWEELPALPTRPFNSPLEIVQPATDPTTDRVYIPGGDASGMLAYDPTSKTTITLPDAPNEGALWRGYAFAWNSVRKSIFLWGGYYSPDSAYFYEYMAAAAIPWRVMNSKGTIPPKLSNSCMVSAYNGTKMILFGGNRGTVMSGTIYILDVLSMTWSQGRNTQAREGAACSVSGDYFIAWGGMSWDPSGKIVPQLDTLVVYNINLNQWTSTFVAKKKATPPPTTSTTTPTSKATIVTQPLGSKESGVDSPATGGETTSNNNATIIGGAVGAGVLIILIATGAFFRRRRSPCQQQKIKIHDHSTPSARFDQKNGQDPKEMRYSRYIIPPLKTATTTPQATFQDTYYVNHLPNTAHRSSLQQGYCQGLQQDSMDSYSWRTPSSPQRIKSSLPSRSASTFIMATSHRHPSSPQNHIVDLTSSSQRNMRNPQDHGTLTHKEYDIPNSTPNNPHGS